MVALCVIFLCRLMWMQCALALVKSVTRDKCQSDGVGGGGGGSLWWRGEEGAGNFTVTFVAICLQVIGAVFTVLLIQNMLKNVYWSCTVFHSAVHVHIFLVCLSILLFIQLSLCRFIFLSSNCYCTFGLSLLFSPPYDPPHPLTPRLLPSRLRSSLYPLLLCLLFLLLSLSHQDAPLRLGSENFSFSSTGAAPSE